MYYRDHVETEQQWGSLVTHSKCRYDVGNVSIRKDQVISMFHNHILMWTHAGEEHCILEGGNIYKESKHPGKILYIVVV